MAETTGIAWTTSSWNPWIGCTEVSPGCDNCYARTLDNRHRYGGATHWGAGVPRYRTKSWGQPIGWNKKAAATGQRWTVFPSLCDPFDNEVPDEWRHALWKLIFDTPALTWLLLTKRIGNAAKMLPAAGLMRHMIPNAWIGASVVNQEEADRDIPKLLATPAVKRFVSYEPALGPVEMTQWLGKVWYAGEPPHYGVDWVIVGGESSQGGVKARPFDLAWARSTVAQCKAAGVPVFVKQLGSNPVRETIHHDYGHFNFKDRAGSDPAEWPENLRVQEFPSVATDGRNAE